MSCSAYGGATAYADKVDEIQDRRDYSCTVISIIGNTQQMDHWQLWCWQHSVSLRRNRERAILTACSPAQEHQHRTGWHRSDAYMGIHLVLKLCMYLARCLRQVCRARALELDGLHFELAVCNFAAISSLYTCVQSLLLGVDRYCPVNSRPCSNWRHHVYRSRTRGTEKRGAPCLAAALLVHTLQLVTSNTVFQPGTAGICLPAVGT